MSSLVGQSAPYLRPGAVLQILRIWANTPPSLMSPSSLPKSSSSLGFFPPKVPPPEVFRGLLFRTLQAALQELLFKPSFWSLIGKGVQFSGPQYVNLQNKSLESNIALITGIKIILAKINASPHSRVLQLRRNVVIVQPSPYP